MEPFNNIWKYHIAEARSAGLMINYLDVYPMSLQRGDSHLLPPNDCLHFCYQGVIEEWQQVSPTVHCIDLWSCLLKCVRRTVPLARNRTRELEWRLRYRQPNLSLTERSPSVSSSGTARPDVASTETGITLVSIRAMDRCFAGSDVVYLQEQTFQCYVLCTVRRGDLATASYWNADVMVSIKTSP
jgi:hypothetical protein